MKDSQWPRYLVFQQVRPDRPHRHAGSVHAPDPEMALLNARDVYVRRPACVSLWVAPEAELFAKTREELEDPSWKPTEDRGTPTEPYCVFQKLGPKGVCTYVGEVEAPTPGRALEAALHTFANPEVTWWWVLPSRVITRTTPEDIESMFGPADRKTFRQSSDFKTLTMLRQIAAESRKDP